MYKLKIAFAYLLFVHSLESFYSGVRAMLMPCYLTIIGNPALLYVLTFMC